MHISHSHLHLSLHSNLCLFSDGPYLSSVMTLKSTSLPQKVTLLVLGAGWTYQFLQPLLKNNSSITYAATTTTGHDGTIPFKYDPTSDDLEPFKRLPLAEYVLITFPLKGKGVSQSLMRMYSQTHSKSPTGVGGGGDPEADDETKYLKTRYIQLGSTGIYTASDWVDSRSPIDTSNERALAEDELISLGGCVLNLAGLYGAQRQPGNWISRVAKTKEQLADKGALHLIHGADVARAIIAVIRFEENQSQQSVDLRSERDTEQASRSLFGRRWIIADCVSYDWWQIVWDFTGESEVENTSDEAPEKIPAEIDKKEQYRAWVLELMQEKGVRGLPRSMESLGRKLDSREFWNTVGKWPERTLKR